MDRSTFRRALRILAERDRITPTSERKYEVHVRASRAQPIPVLRMEESGLRIHCEESVTCRIPKDEVQQKLK